MTVNFDTLSSNGQKMWARAMTHPDLLTSIALALAILIVTLIVSRLAANAVKRVARRFSQTDADRTLPEFLSQVVRWMILTLGLVAVLNRLGIETASFITVLGAASLSIGLALQNTLGNVASGLMILFTKPYRIGDTVKVGEVQGRVHRLGLFDTEIDNLDNVRVMIPNTKIFSNEIYNISTNGALRIEVKVDVGYDTDLEAAMALLSRVAEAQPDHLDGHEVKVCVQDFAASGITLSVWIWVLPINRWSARTQLMIAVKKALDGAGIDIPYPHQVALEKKPPVPVMKA
ncbi:MAG TPA: mechanosensitive ion channel family protein [Asticcacaulis sp.]|nr:mechanosensitive ion channel family protein [Asticcacaulis sp.]